MFGFLKDKLKTAIKKFSSSAEEAVTEEKVEDTHEIERAAKEDARKIEKAAPKKIEKKPKPVTKAPTKPVVKEPVSSAPVKEKAVPAKPEKSIPAPKVVPAPVKSTPIAKTPEPKPIKKATPPEPKVEAPVDKPGFFRKLFGKKEEKAIEQEIKHEEQLEAATEAFAHEETIAEQIAEEDERIEEEREALDEAEDEFEEVLEAPEVIAPTKAIEEPQVELLGLFGKLKDTFTKKKISDEKFEEIFWDLEVAMLESNVALEVIEKIKQDLHEELTTGKISRFGLEDLIVSRLRESIEELFDIEGFDLIARIRASAKPFKICIIGVNGSGKTTTLAKITHLLQQEGLSVVLAASDTFRAAAIDQLSEHATRLGVKLISQGYNADPAAVAFDAIKHAESKGIDVVLIDTAGRLHSNTNLMAELEKVVRVAKPDLKIFVGESITGNDCVEQAKVFNELVGIDAIVLSKADVDEKGGAAISVSYVTQKPILYLGTGQRYEDLEPFRKEKVIEAIGL